MAKTKVVVFDFDGTLYSGIDWTKEWSDYCKMGMRSLFSKLTDKQFENLVKKENMQTFTNNSIISVLKKHGMQASDWLEFRQTHDYFLDYSNCICVSNDELKKFAHNRKLYVVSNAIPKEIKRVADYFQMDMSVFEDVIINDYEHGIDKQFYFEQIIKKEGILPEELFVIGDNMDVDILPAKRIGAKCAFVHDASFKMEDFDL